MDLKTQQRDPHWGPPHFLTQHHDTRTQLGAGCNCCLSRDRIVYTLHYTTLHYTTADYSVVCRTVGHCYTAILPSAAALPLLAARSLVSEGGREGGTSSPTHLRPQTSQLPHYRLQTPTATTGTQQAISRRKGGKENRNQSLISQDIIALAGS